jgi:hypothetical protein
MAAPVRRFLPGESWRVTAYWYAWRSGTLAGHWPSDLEFLKELGWHAAGLARSYGIPPWCCDEGPYWVNMWPEAVWSVTMDQLANHAAEHGAYCDEPGHGYWEAGDY